MANSIYLTSSENSSGKSVIGLGILEMVLRKTQNIGIYRPIVSTPDNEKDLLTRLFLEHFKLTQNYETTYGFHRKQVMNHINNNDWDSVLDKVIQDYKRLEEKYDFVLIIGTDLKKEGVNIDANFNIDFAKNLNTPVLIVGRGDNQNQIEDIIEPAVDLSKQFSKVDCNTIGIIINRTPNNLAYEILVKLRSSVVTLDTPLLAVIKDNKTVKSPTIKEIMDQIGATLLIGEKYIENPAYKYTVAALKPENFLEKVTENCLIITPGDRDDILITVLQAHASKNYPQIAGILLTTEHKPKPSIMKLIEGLSRLVPIISTNKNTFETSLALENVKSSISTKYPQKIDAALHSFEKYVDVSLLEKKISDVISTGMTPRMFQYLLTERAKKRKKVIVLPEGTDERILRATHILLSKGIVSIILLGDKSIIEKEALKLNINLKFKDIEIINPRDSEHFDKYVAKYIELRKHKGVNQEIARDTLKDFSYFGTMMVYFGDADGMVSGALNTTAHTIRPALQLIKTREDVSTVSSVFFMCLYDRVLVYGDCAINPTPNATQLAEIAKASARTAQTFGIEPLVCLLSYSSGTSGTGIDVEKVKDAVKLLDNEKVDFLFDGPIQYDAAVDAEIAKKKLPDSKVAGKGNVLIFPDLNTGNNTYKAVQRETGAVAIGPILQGLKKPVNDLSRGCTITDIINTIIITAIQAEK